MFNCMMYIEGLHTHLHEKKAFLCTECTDLVLSFVYGNVRIKKYHVRNLYGIYIETLWPPWICPPPLEKSLSRACPQFQGCKKFLSTQGLLGAILQNRYEFFNHMYLVINKQI